MKGLGYFSHDVNSRFDLKLRKLRKRYNSDAILFWDLLEEMSSSNGYYPLDDVEFLSTDLSITDDRKEEMVDYMIEIGLLKKTDDNSVYNPRLRQFMEEYAAKSERASTAAKAKRDKDEETNSKADAEQTQSDSKADAEQTQSDSKAKKERKERKERNKERNKQNKTKQSDAAAAADVVDVVDVVSSPDSTALKEQAQSISAEIDSLQAVSDQLDKLIAESAAESVDDSILIDDADEIIFGEEDKIEVPQEPEDSEELNADEILNTFIDPDMKADTDKLRQELISIGLSESVADIKLIMHDNDYIRSKIELLKAQSNIQNPSAWLLKAIENDYKPNVPSKPVSRPASPDLLTATDYFQEFQKRFKLLMNYDFSNKRLYTQAVETLGIPSAVMNVLEGFAAYKDTAGVNDIIHRHNIRNFDDLLTNEKAMRAITAYAAAENYKETQRDPAYIALMQKMGADKEV